MVFTIFSSICAIAFVAIFSWMIFTILRVVFQFFFPRKLVAVKRSFQVGDVTLEELSKYSGQDPYLPILLAVRGRIYDVSAKANFYGPGEPGGRQRVCREPCCSGWPELGPGGVGGASVIIEADSTGLTAG